MRIEQYSKSVCLYYNNSSHRGPGKVVQNLTKGIQAIGGYVTDVLSSRPAKYTGALQFCYPELLQQHKEMGHQILMGPNLFVLPNENPNLCQMFDHFVVPSQWVKELYLQFDELKEKNIHVWPVGIETNLWTPNASKSPTETLDCFIYFKNRSEQDLRIVEAICKKFNLKYKVLKYGSYTENELYSICQTIIANNGFAILLTGTESQGIAYMQILSCNIPCYVFNNPTWKSDDGKYKVPASSVPYFDMECGDIAIDIKLDHFATFLEKVKQQKFSPRKYILQNHTLEASAKHYLNLLRISNGKKPL